MSKCCRSMSAAVAAVVVAGDRAGGRCGICSALAEVREWCGCRNERVGGEGAVLWKGEVALLWLGRVRGAAL